VSTFLHKIGINDTGSRRGPTVLLQAMTSLKGKVEMDK